MARWFDEKEAKRRQAEQEAARAHEAAQESLRPASEQKVKTAPLVVNLDKQTNQSAARVASRIPDETERDGFLNEYIAHVKKQKSPNHQKYAPSIGTMREMTDATVTGGVYADTRAKNEKQRLKEIETQKAGKTAMAELAEMPLMGFDGQSINANTADAATVIRGINAIADDTLRARAAKAFKTLTQTEGSRFYGENADDVGTFLESANLTKEEYRDATEDYASRFYGDGKHDKEDAAAYLKARQEIEESAYSDYAKSQLTAALDKAYTGITGGETPSESAGDEPAEAADEARATEEEQKKEKKPGFWSGLTGKVPEQEEQEKAESPAQAKAQSRIVSQTMTASTAPGFPTAGKKKAEDSGKAPEVQGPVQMTPEERIVAQGGMSFAEWMATPSVSSDGETGAEIRMHEAQTIGEAADALLKGRYDRIEGAGKDELDRMLAESGNARRMIGTLTEADSQRIILGNDMADAVTYGNIAAQGQTVKTLYDVMKSDSFPDELRGDVMAQMVVWAAQAEAMEQAGTLGGDAELPLMERLLTTDEHAMDELASIYAARDELLFDKADMRRAQEEASAQALSDARTAALKGTASEEQLALVRQNAQAGQDELNADMGYVGRLAAVDDYFRPGASKNAVSPFDLSSVKLNLDAQGVIDTGDYQAQLREQMDALLEEDTQTALALGLTLDEYYAKTGGVDMNALCERAASRISQQGAAITDEEMAALDVPFGQGVGAGYTVGAGIRAGGEQWYLDFKDSLYTGYSQGMVLVNAARIQNRYQNEYGAYGRTQYRKDIESALASGTLDENYANALRKALAGAADVYQLGIDPMDFEGDFLKNSAEVRRDIATMEGYMRTNATEDEFKWFGRVKGMTYNVVSAGVAAGTTLATGSSLLGFNTGYSVVGFKNNFDEYLQKGYSIDSARYLGAVNTGLDCAANFGTFEGVLGRMTGMSALTEAARSRIIRNPAGACRGLAAIRTFGEAFSKAFARNEFDEVVHDEFFEGLSANWTDNALGEIFRKVDTGEDITFTDGLNMALNLLNPKNLDVKGAAEGVVSGAVENAIGAVLFSLSGAAGSGVGTLRGVKAAQDLMNGKRTDVENVILDVTKTLGDEQACALLNDYARQQKESKAVAEEIISGKDERGSAAHAEKAKQQADEARAQAEAAQTAADNSRAQFAEASDAVMNGDLTRQKEMTEARVRMGENQKTANEQGAVAARRTDEMQQAAAQRLAEARQAGRKAVIAEDAAAREAMLDDREARTQAIDNEIAQLDAQQQAAEEEFYAATQSYTEAEAMGMDEETLGQLDARMNEIGARLMALYDRREALQNPEAYEARRKAETEIAEREQQAQEEYQRQTEREQTQSEMDEIAPVVRDIRNKRIWLNEQQIAEVLHTTGLRTIAQVNRQYGTQFRVNRKSADVDLDSGFFRELAAQIPGRMDEASAHPETEILNLLDRSGELKGKLGGMEASIGAVGAEDYLNADVSRGNLDPVTQKLASNLKQKTGLELIVMPLADKVRGFYDRENGRLILSSRIGAGEQMRQVVMHELTHYIESTKNYAAYEKAALEAAYRGDTEAMDRDAAEIRKTYEDAGLPCDVNKELAAAATEKLMASLGAWGRTGSETLVYDLLGAKQSFPIRVYNKLTQFLARRKAQKAGGAAAENYKALVRARDALRQAILEAGTWKKGMGGEDATIELFGKTAPVEREVTRGQQTEMEYAIRRDEKGKPVVSVEEDILAGVPQKDWARTVKRALKEKFPNGVTVGSNQIQITGKSRNEITNSKDTMWLKRNQSDVYADKMRAANNADEILQASTDHVSQELTHERKDDIVDFIHGNVQIDVSGQLYDADVVVGAKKDGSMLLYDFVGMTKKEMQRTAGRQSAPHDIRAASLSDTSVTQSNTSVNPYDMPNDVEYAVAPRQFGNQTAQELDTLTDSVKEFLRGDQYETVTNREQVQRANDDINARGIDTVVNDLLARDRWTADDHAAAAVACIRAQNEGLMTTAYVIAKAYDEQGTNAGQALQARQIIGKLTAEGALVEAAKKADHANAKKGLVDGDIPVGSQAPVKGWRDRQQRSKEGAEREQNVSQTGEFDPGNPFNKGRTSVLPQEAVTGVSGAAGDAVQGSFIERPLPPVLENVYTAAELIQRQIDKLPSDVKYDNPWNMPLESWKTELIDQYGLNGTKLVGDTYSYATAKERMLAAILATDNNVRGDGLLTLCQQLEAMKQGLAVVTEADLNYIAGQMSTFLYAEGADLEGMPVTTEGKTALQRVYNAQANVVQDSMMGKVNALGYTNMLSGTKTWIKNIASNILIRPLELASEKIGGVIEGAFITKRTGNRTTDAPNRAERAAGREAFTGEIGQTMVDYFVTHADTGHGSGFDLSHNNRTFNNEWLQAYKNIVDFAMQVGDRPFWEQCYTEELAVIKRLGTKIPDTQRVDGREVKVLRDMTLEEMKTEAAVRATERVFQEDNNIVSAINGARRESPMIDLMITSIMPFLKTPTNVASRMMQYSPIGLARAIIQYGLWDGKRNGGANFDQRKFVMNLGRGLTGTGVAIVGALLASLGAIQPGREDEEDKKLGVIRKAQGRSYSTYFKLGDWEIPLDFAQPSSGPLYIGAKIAWALEEMGDDVNVLSLIGTVLYGSALETGNQLFDNSFLSGFSALFSGYNDAAGIASNIAENIAENQASRLTPSAIRALAKVTDPYVRDVYSQNAVKQFLNRQIVQNWPLLRQTLPVKTDITGDATLQNGYYNWGQENQNAALHFLNAFATPWTTLGEKNDAALDTMIDLSYRTGETSFLPGEMVSASKYEVNITKTLAKELKVGKVGFNQYEGFKILLTDEEKRWANSTYADTLFNGSGRDVIGLRAMMSGNRWERMSDEERIEAVRDMQKTAKKQVLTELVRRKKEAGEIR
nr:MAG TPA: PolyVal Metallopeptidase superfamily domain [Caudoviricetes sp.]